MCSRFFFKQKTASALRISDWSSDVCSSDLPAAGPRRGGAAPCRGHAEAELCRTRLARGPHADGPVRRDRRQHVARRRREHRRLRGLPASGRSTARAARDGVAGGRDRKSVVEGKGVSVRVNPGGRRIINKKKEEENNHK